MSGEPVDERDAVVLMPDAGADAATPAPGPAAPASATPTAGATSAPAAGPAPAAAPAPRAWWRRLRRGSQVTPPEAEVVELPGPHDPTSLLFKSPFQIGFFGTLGGLVAVALVATLGALQSVLILVVLSLFLALGLNPGVEWLHRRGAPRSVAVAAVALGLILVLGLGAWAVLPLMSQQINALVNDTPGYLEDLRSNQQLAELDAQFGVIDRVTEAITSGAWIEGLFGGILGAGIAIANVVFSLVITLVLSLYFLASLPAIKMAIFELAPASRRPRARYLANEVFRRVGGYVVGLFAVVGLAGATSFLFLNVIGLGELSLALAVLVMVFAFIPLVGPTASMLIVSFIAFSVSPTAGIATLAFFLVYQQIDIYLVQPRIFSRSVNVPGALVVLAALSGGLLFGIAGALIAIPTAASLLLLYREVLIPELDRR